MAMEQVTLQLNETQKGAFKMMDGNEEMGEMEVSIHDGVMTVYHTEVKEQAEGKGYAKRLLAAMVDHARKNHLAIKPLCSFVHAQFKRHPKDYADVWKEE
jgi:uncharacterized protein